MCYVQPKQKIEDEEEKGTAAIIQRMVIYHTAALSASLFSTLPALTAMLLYTSFTDGGGEHLPSTASSEAVSDG